MSTSNTDPRSAVRAALAACPAGLPVSRGLLELPDELDNHRELREQMALGAAGGPELETTGEVTEMRPTRGRLALPLPGGIVPKATPGSEDRGDRQLLQFGPTAMVRTDPTDTEETLTMLDGLIANAGDQDKREGAVAFKSRMVSMLDSTDRAHRLMAANPNSMANWLPPVVAAVAALTEAGHTTFSIPATKVLRMPATLAQFSRIDYGDTNELSRRVFGHMLADIFDLDDADADMPVFFKTGVFSAKFRFGLARIDRACDLGPAVQVATNHAMTLGAGASVDLVIREFIADGRGDDAPTIYDGLPLRCEARAFVDFDNPRVLGVVPYWHPSVMTPTLAKGNLAPADHAAAHDAATYAEALPWLEERFAEILPEVISRLEDLAPMIAKTGVSGQWSVDIMAEGDELFLIDMATMSTSALSETLAITEEYATVSLDEIAEFNARVDESDWDEAPSLTSPAGRGSLFDVIDMYACDRDGADQRGLAVDFAGAYAHAVDKACAELGVTALTEPDKPAPSRIKTAARRLLGR